MLQVKAWLELARWHDCVVVGLMTVLGGYLGNGWGASSALAGGLAVGVMMLLAAVANIINDYWDRDVDQFQKPYRPIPSGRIAPRAALLGAFGGALIALMLAGALGLHHIMAAFLILVLSVSYSAWLKNTVLFGNLCVALTCATTVLFGGLAVAGQVSLLVAVNGLVLMLFILAREILKTIADQTGDRQAGLKTLATELNPQWTFYVFYGVLGGFVGATLLPWGLGLASMRYLPATLLCTLFPIGVMVFRLHSEKSEQVVVWSLKTMKLVMFSSAVPILLLR